MAIRAVHPEKEGGAALVTQAASPQNVLFDQEQSLRRTILPEGNTPQSEQRSDTEPLPKHRRWRRAAACLGGVSLAAFLGGGLAGSMTTPAHVPFGASQADMKVTLDSHRSVDFGMPGELTWRQNSNELPLGFGVKFTIKGMPIEDNHSKSGTTITQEDIQRYENFFGDHDQIERTVSRAAKRHFVAWGLGSLAAVDIALIGAYLGGQVLLDKRVRRDIASNIHNHRNGLRATAATSVLLLSILTAGVSKQSTVHAEDNSVRISREFDGTPLENARIKGKMLNDVINSFGTEAMRFLDQNEKFYKTATDNLEQAFKQSPTVLTADKLHTTFLFETGLHCNVGMMKVLGKATQLFKPAFVLDGGDTTFSGSSFEAACVRTLRDYVRRTPIITSPGDHDSTDTMSQERKNRIIVLDGQPITVAGVQIRGDADPRHASFLQKVQPRSGRHETVAQMGEREAQEALAGGQTDDIALNNEPGANHQLIADGSISLALDGGYEADIKVSTAPNDRQVVHYTGKSAGGASKQRLTIGPLQDTPAEFTIFQLDKVTHNPTSYQVITVQTDASVIIEEPVMLTADYPKASWLP